MKKGKKHIYITKDGKEIYKTKELDSKLSEGVFYCDAKKGTYHVIDERGLLATTKRIPGLHYTKKKMERIVTLFIIKKNMFHFRQVIIQQRVCC